MQSVSESRRGHRKIWGRHKGTVSFRKSRIPYSVAAINFAVPFLLYKKLIDF